MSGLGIGFTAGGATGGLDATFGLLVGQTALIQASVGTLTEQEATGLVSTSFSGLGLEAGSAIDLNGQLTQQQALIQGISQSDGTTGVTQNALSQIGAIAQSFVTQVGELSNLDPATVDTVAAQAQTALQQLAGILDTQYAGSYVFAGQQSGTPPVPDPDGILGSGFYTQIASAVGALGTAGSAATISATQAIASSNAAGTSPFSAYLSQPASALQPALPSVAIGYGQYVTTGVVASANTFAVSTGPSTTGSYTRDLMRALATVGSLSSAQTNDAGFTALVQDTLGTLQGVVGAVADEQGILGGRQNVIDQAGTAMTTVNTALQTQIGGIQNVDVASVSVKLSETQASLQASYKMIASFETNTLLTYLPV
jgi:flagellin-like hook-associated protein FlgL